MEESYLSKTQETSQQTSSDSVNKVPKINSIGIIIIVLLLTGALIYVGYQNYLLQQKLQQLVEQQATSKNANTTDSTLPNPQKASLAEALSQYCLNNKINLDKLPFTLSQALKTTYTIQDSLVCYVPEENYASMNISNEPSENTVDSRTVYFFHKNSRYTGMGDDFQPLSNYKTITINGQTYWLNIREPGPYGINSLGVWVDLIGEKKDDRSGTIVRVKNLDVISNEQFLGLVRKYGTLSTDGGNGTLYTVNDPAKKVQFINEIVKLAPNNNDIKISAQKILTDLNGILFSNLPTSNTNDNQETSTIAYTSSFEKLSFRYPSTWKIVPAELQASFSSADTLSIQDPNKKVIINWISALDGIGGSCDPNIPYNQTEGEMGAPCPLYEVIEKQKLTSTDFYYVAYLVTRDGKTYEPVFALQSTSGLLTTKRTLGYLLFTGKYNGKVNAGLSGKGLVSGERDVALKFFSTPEAQQAKNIILSASY